MLFGYGRLGMLEKFLDGLKINSKYQILKYG